MILKEYIKQLQELPQDLECFYSGDDEGNHYSQLIYSPSVQKVADLDLECTSKTKSKEVVVIN